MVGGANSQIYIYINQIQTLKNILKHPERYENRLLDMVAERHTVSVQMLTYLWERLHLGAALGSPGGLLPGQNPGEGSEGRGEGKDKENEGFRVGRVKSMNPTKVLDSDRFSCHCCLGV